MNKRSAVALVGILASGLLGGCAGTNEAAPGATTTATPLTTASSTAFDPGVDGPVLTRLVEGQSSGQALRGSRAKDITEYLPNVRWAFKDGSPEFRNGGIVIGRVTDVEPLAAFSYVNGPAGERVAFDDPTGRIRFATVTVAVEEGWLPVAADEVKIALRLSEEDTWEAQREALLSDWGTAVAVLSTPFRWTGIEKPDIYAPGLWGAGFGRVTVDGTLRFDGLEAAGSEWMMADIETVQDLRDAAAQEPRVVMLDNPTIFR